MVNTRLLLLAAGQGSRLKPLTNNIPKGMVKIHKISLIENIISLAQFNNIFDIDIVTGYKESKINFQNVNKIYNSKYKSSNMFYSFLVALNSYNKINFDLIISYSDIIYNNKVLKELYLSKKDITVVVDNNWKDYWKLRFENPLSDAESCIIKNNTIIEIGKKIENYNKSKYQYIGLVKIKKKQLIKIKNNFIKLKKYNFNNFKYKKAYFTDFLNYLTDLKYKISPMIINKNWLEVDNKKDYTIARELTLKEKNFLKIKR